MDFLAGRPNPVLSVREPDPVDASSAVRKRQAEGPAFANVNKPEWTAP